MAEEDTDMQRQEIMQMEDDSLYRYQEVVNP